MKLTKIEAVKIAGTELVEAVEEVNCEHTNSVTDGTEYQGYTLFSADVENDTHRVTAYYVVDTDELNAVENLDEINWEIDHYEVEEV